MTKIWGTDYAASQLFLLCSTKISARGQLWTQGAVWGEAASDSTQFSNMQDRLLSPERTEPTGLPSRHLVRVRAVCRGSTGRVWAEGTVKERGLVPRELEVLLMK